MTSLPPHERARRGLAFMRQRDNVFIDLTVEENLRLAVGPDGFTRFHESYPAWAVDLLGRKRAGLLSGGQKQRLAWAMATLRPSRLLLADEAEAGMSIRLPVPATSTFLFVGHAGHAISRYCDEVIDRWRRGENPADEDAWVLASLPFVDELQKLVRKADVPWLLELLRSDRASLRRLAVNIARPLDDHGMQKEVNRRWRAEPHLHTKLSMIFFLAHSPLLDWSEVLAFLDSACEEALPLILSYYENHPKGAVRAIAERVQNPQFARSRPLYLFALRELARCGKTLPAGLEACIKVLEKSDDSTLALLARQLREARTI